MKTMKLFRGLAALALAAIMLLGAFGCSTQPGATEPAQTGAEPTVAPADPTAPVEQTPVADVPVADVPADRYDATVTPRTGNNETMPLVISSLTIDGLFSPFFYTSGTDGTIVDYTQVGMLTVDSGGAPIAGVDQPCVAYSFDQAVTEDQSESIYTLTLKKGLTFSDGSPLTMKDVLFSLYTFLDPMYDGSSTLYSLPIQGLREYRSQSTAEQADAIETAMNAILAAGFTLDESGAMVYPAAEGVSAEDQKLFWDALPAIGENFTGRIVNYCMSTLNNDEYAAKLVGEGTTWAMIDVNDSVRNAYALTGWNLGKLTPDLHFTDANGREYDLNTQEYTIADCWNSIITTYDFDIVAVQAEQADEAYDVKNVLSKGFISEKSKDHDRVDSVSGITTGTRVCEDGVERETLTIKLYNVDPVAMYQMGFVVTSCDYYTKGFTGTLDEHGVSFNDASFMDCLKEKNKLPFGAGPYIFKEFKDDVVTYEANDLYMLGSPKIKNFRIQHVEAGAQMDAVRTGMVHFSEPNATTGNVDLLNSSEEGISKLAYKLVDVNGYGYIGISAEAFPDWNVRKALTHAINTELTVSDFYGELAQTIWRPKTVVCWAYPKDSKALYPYDGTGATSKQLLLDAGYIYDEAANIMYYPEGHEKAGQQLTLKATLPSDAADHPAGVVFLDMQKVLGAIGVKVDIEVDNSAINKLKLGYPASNIAMWAAAWGDGPIDPDLYQVWYSDSSENQSDSPKAKGLYWLYNNGTDDQKSTLRKLNDLIKAGRGTLDIEERKAIYEKAFEIAVSLVTEIPTYQRKDLFVFNKDVINADTLMSGDLLSPFLKPLGYIWNVELIG